jgi:hypothetical protein
LPCPVLSSTRHLRADEQARPGVDDAVTSLDITEFDTPASSLDSYQYLKTFQRDL